MIRLHNTLSGETEEFEPLRSGKAGMYHCGPTVYGYAHIGNLRSYILADILRRMFEYEQYEVKQVINITDVGHLVSDGDEGADKMDVAREREGKSSKEIADFYTEAFLRDLAFLNIETDGTVFPKASEHVQEQIALIEELERKGFTYKTSDGVYFDTAKFPDYGKLGNINLSGLEEGARIGVNTEKKNPTDFALWKLSLPSTGSGQAAKREQEWQSPWGVGFPGWHIECSAMSMHYLGETFDLHTGGVDHIPVHHQNEIAQSEAATGKKFVDYWLHNEFMKVEGQKMSKSLGNTFTLEDLMHKGFSPLAYRYFLLLSHYRTQTNFTWEGLQSAQNAYRKLKEIISSFPSGGSVDEAYRTEFKEAVENDLNTPAALGVLWKLVRDDSVSPADKRATILDFDAILGLELDVNEYAVQEIPETVKALLKERKQARIDKDFTRSDNLRKQIEEQGFSIEDKGDRQELRRA